MGAPPARRTLSMCHQRPSRRRGPGIDLPDKALGSVLVRSTSVSLVGGSLTSETLVLRFVRLLFASCASRVRQLTGRSRMKTTVPGPLETPGPDLGGVGGL